MADNVLLLRYFEAYGAVEKALSVFKKRGSQHETTLRRFSITPEGLQVGPVLTNFQGLLTGVPTFIPSTDSASLSSTEEALTRATAAASLS